MFRIARQGWLHRRRMLACFVLVLLASACSSTVDGESEKTRNGLALVQEALYRMNKQSAVLFQGMSSLKLMGMGPTPVAAFKGEYRNGQEMVIQEISSSENQLAEKQTEPTVFNYRLADNGQWQPLNHGVKPMLYKNKNPLTELTRLYSSSLSVNRQRDLEHKEPELSWVLEGTWDAARLVPVIISDLKEQQDQIQVEPLVEQTRALHPESDSDDTLPLKRVQQIVEEKAKAMQERLDTMQAQGRWQLWINRETGLPKRLVTETSLSYLVQGSKQTEVVWTEYTFAYS